MKPRSLITNLVIFSLTTGVFTGCTITEKQKLKITPSPVPTGAAEGKLPMSVALVLDKEFKTTGLKFQQAGFPWFVTQEVIFQAGPHLQRYAEDVTKALFTQVMEFDSADAAVGKTDIILVPRVAQSVIDLRNPVYWSVVVEWTVKDRAAQQKLWLTSIESKATEKGAIFGVKQKLTTVVQSCLDDLSQKTFNVFQQSPEMKRLATQPESRTPTAPK
jgi:hypothetical protein